MKIAYLGQMADVSKETSIAKKIASQTAAWQKADHDVRYFALAASTICWSGLSHVPTELVSHGSPMARISASWELARRIRAWAPELIYFRFAYHSPGLPALFRDIPTIAEINSDDLREYPLTLSRVRVWYHRLTRARLLRPVAGYVAVTKELAALFQGWGRPTQVVGNGIALDDFTPAPVPTGNPQRIVFVGTAGSPWHGLERVGELAQFLPGVQVDVVGLDDVAWAAQTGRARPANLKLHGPLKRSAYERIIASATAAIGSLALYKNGMNEACPLKVREYLAFGLPVIAAYEDTDVSADADYFLRLPNSAANLQPQRESIEAFLASWRSRRVPRAAIVHLDTGVKELQRLEFLQRFAGRRAR